MLLHGFVTLWLNPNAFGMTIDMPNLDLPDMPCDYQTITQAIIGVSQDLGLRMQNLMSILGINESSATDLLCGQGMLLENTQVQARAVDLLRLHNSLRSLVGGDATLARGWLHSPNKTFAGQKPIDVLQQADGIARISEHLDASLGR